MSDWFDAARGAHSLAGLAGAAVYGVYQISSLVLSGQPVSRVELVRAGVNVLAAGLVGSISAYFLASELAVLVPFASLKNATLLAFAMGAIGWEVLPFVISGVRRRAQREADRQGGQG